MKKIIKKLLLDFTLLCLAMFTILLFWKNTLLTTIILVIITIGMLVKFNKTDRLFFIIISLSATIFESITISTGAWIFSTQQILIVPLWIPLYWGMGGIVMKDIYLLLKE